VLQPESKIAKMTVKNKAIGVLNWLFIVGSSSAGKILHSIDH